MTLPRENDGSDEQLLELPTIHDPNPPQPPSPPPSFARLHPAFYVAVWISLSSAVILFNKQIFSGYGFAFPIFLTTWHLVFATMATQLLARTTTLLDGRHRVRMTGKVYLRAIAPIGFFFSLSLICGNKAILYLSVAFIQMLKATTPVAVLFASWAMSIDSPSRKTLINVSFIVLGVILASWGEIDFDITGVLFQVAGICFEATRLVMVQRLLSSAEYKMDPLVSLYYFAPVCALINSVIFLAVEASSITWHDITQKAGISVLVLSAFVAFGLNVSVVFLIGRTSSLVFTLCGVLKDILLVVLSIIIWGTTVTLLQFLGYSVALAGLVWYKLGPEKTAEQLEVFRARCKESKGVRALAIGAALVFGAAVVWYAFAGPDSAAAAAAVAL